MKQPSRGGPSPGANGWGHRPSRCGGCRTILNATSDPRGRGAPHPGDLTICIRCGTVHRFDPELRLKVATKEEIEQLPQSTLEELAEQQARFKAFHGLAPVISLPPRKPS